MNPEQQEVAEQIRQGTYFAEARGWYQALYIGPISERSFFLVIAALAGLVALVGFVAFVLLMPITEKYGLTLSATAPEQSIPFISPIRSKGQPLEIALERFMIRSYIERREGYRAADAATNDAFIRAQSDAPTYTAYTALYGAANPRSPVNVLGTQGQRIAVVQNIAINPSVEPRLATVKFSTELEGIGTTAKTQWTATLGYYYSPPETTEVVDPQTGEPRLTVTDPQFKVVNYAVTQTP